MCKTCPSDQSGGVKCPLDPYFIVPDKCKCVDFQVFFVCLNEIVVTFKILETTSDSNAISCIR